MTDLNKIIEALDLLKSLNISTNPEAKQIDIYARFIGKKVIVRTYKSGVDFGEVIAINESAVHLKNARKVWRWHANEGVSLLDVSVHGIDQSKSKITSQVDSLFICEDYSITDELSEIAIKSIETAPVARK